MKCPLCRQVNPLENNYCGKCGTSLTKNGSKGSKIFGSRKEARIEIEKDNFDWIELSAEFTNVINKVAESNSCFFITGKAGTGKSTLLQYIYHHTKKNCILLAPTGRAAINIEGQTIHSFFGLDWGVIQPDDYKEHFVNDVQNVELIIIDEISMVRADILDSIDASLRFTMRKNIPFAGKQMIFFGDPYQLPPVVPSGKEIKQFFTEYYKSPYFFDSKVYKKANFQVIELKRVFRQTDQSFIKILNNIRVAKYSESDLHFINERVSGKYEFNDLVVALTPYKKKAALINESELVSIKAKEKKFYAKIQGEIKASNVPVPEVLILKKGAQVMFVKNKGSDWVNGDLGIVHSVMDDKVLVLKDNVKYTVERETWEDFKYRIDKKTKKLRKEVVGKFTQIPLILAWAITIHKGQGATLPGVHVDLDRGSFDYGQTYVALSRTRRITDLSLERAIIDSDIRVDFRINEFFEKLK